MRKIFNVSGNCSPDRHYMVDIGPKLCMIRAMVDRGEYFTINRARQYGKTTTLKALEHYLEKDYVVISMDFQMMSYADFENESAFVEAFSRELLQCKTESMPGEILKQLQRFAGDTEHKTRLAVLFQTLSKWCGMSEKPVVLLIDEVDSATNNQVFLDFLSQLRGYYLKRDMKPTFFSVILAGVYDVKNIRRKIRQDDEHKVNSPWNIAADFLVDMSFSAKDIEGMLAEYERDNNTGMDKERIARLIYDYTSGYPFLVSRICKLIDERVVGSHGFPDRKKAWTNQGFLYAVNMLLTEKNTLFESLVNKIEDYPRLREMIYALLFTGERIPYISLNRSIETAEMFGFVKNCEGNVAISNRIFETVLYNLFLSEEIPQNRMFKAGLQNKSQFVRNGHLNMEKILEKFVVHFDSVYGDQKQEFLEEDGRRYFLLYLKPIINGTGNYYIESRTRNMERTDVIVDYLGDQFVIEMKIWRGEAYNKRGEEQLAEYLDYYNLKKGYMLSFNFSKKKQIGLKEVMLGDKILIEAVV